MKKVLFALAVMCAGCQQTTQDKVRELVEDYFMENANDPDVLEIVSVSDVQPDSVYVYSQEYKYKIDTMEIQHYVDMTYLAMEADELDKAEEYLRKSNDYYEVR